MRTRKTVGWLICAALLVVILLQVPTVAGLACHAVGLNFYASGNYLAAASAFKGAVLLNSRSARSYVELGSSYLALEKYVQAEKAFLKAKSIQDESCAACGLGMTYYGLERHDDAEKEFKRAIILNPGDVCAYHQFGKMYYETGKYHEAIAAFQRSSTLRPSTGTYVYLGNSYVYLREFAQGVDAYKEAIKLDAGNRRAHLQLGIAYDYLRRDGEAAEAYKEALKLDPEDEGAHYSLALIYVSMHNKPAALAEYEILRKLNPDMAAGLLEEIALSENRERGKEKLYLVPLGDFSPASLTKLANFCKEKAGVEAILTQPVSFTLSTVDKRRDQVIAEDALDLMKRKYPHLVADPNAILIGVTDKDMYIREENWQYAFSYWIHRRFAIVSSARMNPVNVGKPANDDLLEARLRKMVLKNIGVLYHLWPTNHDPKSVLYDEIEGVEDLDNMREHP